MDGNERTVREESPPFQREVLQFNNGIQLIQQKEYAQAAAHFQEAAKTGNAAALFGQAVCEIALGQEQQASQHLEQMNQLISVPPQKCDPQAINPPTTAEDQVSAYHCRQKVRKVARKLRLLVEKIVADRVPGFFRKIQAFRQLNPYINLLEHTGTICCQNNRTSNCCTEALVEQLKLWDSEGLPLETKKK